jgi:spore coat polysaccharide biosynthesis predicted glycosyltransferase SpsG
MNEFPLIQIFCDGNKEIGFGHIRRSSALAVYLCNQNIPAVLIGLSEDSEALLPKRNFSDAMVKVAVFDSMSGIDDLILSFQKKGIKTVTLDWFGNIVSDINIVVFPHQEVKALSKSYVGFDNIIIRDQILSLPIMPLTGSSQKVVISLGGGDLLGQSFNAAESLIAQGFDVTLIKGPLAKIDVNKCSFPVLVNPSNFPEILNSCDWAVTNGGGCFFEALYLGKPAFVLPQTDMELKIALYATQFEAILGMGMEELNNINQTKFETVSQNGMNLIDGNGLSRIASIIKELL